MLWNGSWIGHVLYVWWREHMEAHWSWLPWLGEISPLDILAQICFYFFAKQALPTSIVKQLHAQARSAYFCACEGIFLKNLLDCDKWIAKRNVFLHFKAFNFKIWIWISTAFGFFKRLEILNCCYWIIDSDHWVQITLVNNIFWFKVLFYDISFCTLYFQVWKLPFVLPFVAPLPWLSQAWISQGGLLFVETKLWEHTLDSWWCICCQFLAVAFSG